MFRVIQKSIINIFFFINNYALLRQKETTDKSPKSEKIMFLDWT